MIIHPEAMLLIDGAIATVFLIFLEHCLGWKSESESDENHEGKHPE